MYIVIFSLLLGLFLGKFAGKKLLRFNDLAFTLVSTAFVFIMGISLGFSRSTFSQMGNLLTGSIVIALASSLGSIFCVSILNKFWRIKHD